MKPAKRLETVDTCVLEARLTAGSAAHGAAPGGYILMAQRPKAGLLGGAPPGPLACSVPSQFFGMLSMMSAPACPCAGGQRALEVWL